MFSVSLLPFMSLLRVSSYKHNKIHLKPPFTLSKTGGGVGGAVLRCFFWAFFGL